MARLSNVKRLVREMRTNTGLRREAHEMSLYVSIVLLSALMVFDTGHPPDANEVLLVALSTTVGLVLAHAFAVWLSTRLIGHSSSQVAPWDVLRVELGGGLAVALVTVLAVLVAPTAAELAAARLAVAGTIGLQVFLESRVRWSTPRAILNGVVALLLGVIVSSVKGLLGH
jgi:hypothetical protein